MASGSFGVSTSNGYISGSVTWQEQNTNITNNTSDVYVEMRLSRTNSGYTTTGSGTFTINVNGTNVSNSPSFSLTQNSNTLMVSGTVTVPHNSDGTKAITISWSGSSNVFTVNNGSGTATLDTIPRASTVSSAISWTAGTQNLTVSLNVHDSSFTHHMALQVQDPTGNWVTVADRTGITGSSYTFVFTQSENTTAYQQIKQYENRPAQIYLDTYDSSNNFIGETNSTGTVYAIPTATATLNSNNSFNIGSSVPYTLNNYTTGSTGGFTYDLIMTIGSFTKTWSGTTASSGTLTFTSSDYTSMYNQTPTSNSVSGNIQVKTYYNGVLTEDGNPTSDKTNFTANVVNSNPTFGTGYSYTDTNSTTSGITGDASYIIQNNSTVQVTLPTTAFATPVNGATMTTGSAKYTFVLNGVTKTATQGGSNIVLSFGTVNASTNQTLTVTATDSRGNSTTTSMTVKMLAYQAPVVTATVARLNGFENEIDITLSGSISPLTTTAQKNALTSISGEPAPLEYCYAENVTGSTFSAWTAFTYTTSGATYTATNTSVSLDNTKSYIFQIRATDKLSTSTQSYTVASGSPVLFLDFDLDSVGVGKFPTGTGTFETNKDAIIGGNLQVNNKPYVTEVTGSIPATANWYRVAQSVSGILNNIAEFEILAPLSSHHSTSKVMASINYANSGYTGYTSLVQLNHSVYNTNSSGGVTQVRIVYNTTYSGNYAYLEVYCPNASSFNLTTRMIGGEGWSLITPVTGSVPSGYTSTTITLYAGGITSTNGIALQDNGTSGIQFLNNSGIMFDSYGNIKPRNNSTYASTGSWGVINTSGQTQLFVPLGSNGGQVQINNGRNAVSSAGGEWRLEVVTMNIGSSGSATNISGSVTFGTAFTQTPNIMFAMITQTVGYVDVMCEPFIYSQSTTGFSCKFTTYNATADFGSGTLICNFLVYGK